MDHQHILYDVRESVATITLNRPDRLNAWTLTMEGEVRQAMEAASADRGVRAILLTGAGRGFCAGADMELLSGIQQEGGEPTAPPPPFDPASRADYQSRYSYFPAVPKPVIALINGPAAGLGLIMALYCDMRFAADSAVFTTAFSRRGLIAEHGISWLLPRLVGQANALDLMLSARRVSAEEAARIGLVNRVFPADRLMAEGIAYARDLAENVSPRSMRVMKRQLWETPFLDLVRSIEIANHEMHESFASEDFREGVAHFLEKRPPRFSGR